MWKYLQKYLNGIQNSVSFFEFKFDVISSLDFWSISIHRWSLKSLEHQVHIKLRTNHMNITLHSMVPSNASKYLVDSWFLSNIHFLAFSWSKNVLKTASDLFFNIINFIKFTLLASTMRKVRPRGLFSSLWWLIIPESLSLVDDSHVFCSY